MNKSPDAFRTISEVADWLGIQAHVLRFWESKFTQVKPIKRAGGRRYYRPADMLLLGGIKKLLHDDGLTIKGVQKILREEGMSHVSALSQPVDDMPTPAEEQASKALPETGVVLNFAAGEKTAAEKSATTDFDPAPPVATASEHPLPPEAAAQDEAAPTDPAPMPSAPSPQPPEDDHPRATPDPLAPSDARTEDAPRLADAPAASTQEEIAATPEAAPAEEAASLPGFLRRPLGAEEGSAPEAEEADDTPRPAVLDLPAFTPEADFPARPGLLSRLPRVRRLPRHVQPQVAGLLLELAEMRQAMDAAMGAETNR